MIIFTYNQKPKQMAKPRFELLQQKATTSVIVKEYVLDSEEDCMSLVYTELISQDGAVLDTFLTDNCGDGISEAEFPGLRREVQEFLFPEEFEIKSNQ